MRRSRQLLRPLEVCLNVLFCQASVAHTKLSLKNNKIRKLLHIKAQRQTIQPFAEPVMKYVELCNSFLSSECTTPQTNVLSRIPNAISCYKQISNVSEPAPRQASTQGWKMNRQRGWDHFCRLFDMIENMIVIL